MNRHVPGRARDPHTLGALQRGVDEDPRTLLTEDLLSRLSVLLGRTTGA